MRAELIGHGFLDVYRQIGASAPQPSAQQLLNGGFHQEQGYWLDRQRLAIQLQFLQSGWRYSLNASPTGGLQLSNSGITGNSSLQLTPGGSLTQEELARYPQLAYYAVLQFPAGVSLATLQTFLRGQVAVSAVDSTGTLEYATGLQIAGVLDDLYYYPGRLGAIFDRDADFIHYGTTIHTNGRQSQSMLTPGTAARAV